MAGLYTTTKLLEVQRKINSLPAFFLTFFPRQINFEEDEIAFDKVSTNYKRLAPFVAPNVQGRVLRDRGYTTKTFKPAYVKPKHVVDPRRAIPRMAGEAIGGTLRGWYRSYLDGSADDEKIHTTLAGNPDRLEALMIAVMGGEAPGAWESTLARARA